MKITGSKIFEINIPVIGKCSTRLIRFNIFSNLTRAPTKRPLSSGVKILCNIYNLLISFLEKELCEGEGKHDAGGGKSGVKF